MGFNSSRNLMRSVSKIAIIAATAAALAGCGGTTAMSDENAPPSTAPSEATAPDNQDFVGGAAFWGARFEANREDVNAALSFARNLRMMGGARQAVAVLKDVVMKAPDDARVLAEYGKALTAAGRAKDALPFLSRSAQMKGDDWTTLSAYGVALDQTGSHQAAREIYQAALTLSPNNAVVESNIAMSQMLDGRLDQAEVTFRRLVARPDATPQMRQNLAMVETLKGNVIEAEQLAREDLPPSEATNNIAVLRQLDARNAKINVTPLPPPPLQAPAKSSSLSAPVIADTAEEIEEPKTAEVTTPAPATKPAATPKPAPFMMTPISDDQDAPATAATPAAPVAIAPTAAAAPAQAAATTPTAQTETAPAAQPAAEQKPIASNEATRKPTPVLRKTYDVYRRTPSVSVANAQQ